MEMEEIVERVAAWEGVLTLRPAPGDGSPEISWGDVFFYVAPDGVVPTGQPFATLVNKDYPGEPHAGLDRPGSFRVNIDAQGQQAPASPVVGAGAEPNVPDLLTQHPTYGELGWVAVVDPGVRTGGQVLTLLTAAHAAALARWRRRHRDDQSAAGDRSAG